MFLNPNKGKASYVSDQLSEKPLRSIAKTISWRFIGTLDTIVISRILTGKVETALAIGSVELVTKMILYFGHERIWNSINFGKE
ncbi:putative membrane protein [Gillisia mitskevichiae]|uniref:Putative membrane protein n=1 Tax=Gillisia mitskevichiae TaxID=270921 RepID=A0A495PZZ1_9FLAO|nr:DUF2061 domain-containing protein [Gillisia mitskevichiae]RKS56122.1 putative membrane protein [Gillisia mitskevichiae]